MAGSGSFSSRPTGFTDLPLELRRMVYRHILLQPEPIDLQWKMVTPGRSLKFIQNAGEKRTSILLVSRQISGEALDVLYGENLFEIQIQSHSARVQQFSASNRQRVRRLQVVFYSFFRNPANITKRISPKLLSGLTKLCVVLAPDRHHLKKPEKVKNHHNWCTSVLKYFDKHVKNVSCVEYDHGGNVAGGKVFKDNISRDLRKVRTKRGGWYYRKNADHEEEDAE